MKNVDEHQITHRHVLKWPDYMAQMAVDRILRNRSVGSSKSVKPHAVLSNPGIPTRRKSNAQATLTSKGAKISKPAGRKSMVNASDSVTQRSVQSSDSLLDLHPNQGRRESQKSEHRCTDASLVTPGGLSSSTCSARFAKSDLSRRDQPITAMMTDNILEKATAHLVAQDPRLRPIIDEHYCHVFSPEGMAQNCNPFISLVSGIMAQQVSGAAASSIRRKFIGLFRDTSTGEPLEEEQAFPTPGKVAQCSVPFLRQAGLSERKAEYVKGLAEKFVNGELSTKMLINASDDEVMKKLTAVRGLGKWSVEMFACFALKRMDILSTGDLGVQRGMAVFMGKDVSRLRAKGGGKWKYMSEQDMLRYSERFAPYRSVFMWYMWRMEGVNVNTLEGK